MFAAQQLKERMDEKPFRPFRIKISNGDAYDIRNHDAAWVLRNAIEIGLDLILTVLLHKLVAVHSSISPAWKTIPNPKAA